MLCIIVCEKDFVVYFISCSCFYFYSCDMFFGWLKIFGFDGVRIGYLRRWFVFELNVFYGDVWIESVIYKNISEWEFLVKVFFFLFLLK